MKSTIISSSIAAMSMAQSVADLLAGYKEVANDLVNQEEETTDSMSDLISALVDELKEQEAVQSILQATIAQMQSSLDATSDRLDDTNGRLDAQVVQLDATDSRVGNIASEVDVLASKAIVDDYFWTNPAFPFAKDYCYQTIAVGAGETFDLSANIAASWSEVQGRYQLELYVQRDSVKVAYAYDVKDTGHDGTNNSVTLLYRDQVDRDTTFNLCYRADHSLTGKWIAAGMFQYGYKVYGTGHVNVN